MTHYPIEAWADFSRGLGTTAVRAAMEDHKRKCARCARLASLMGHVAATARTDVEFAVPDDVLQAALDLFAGANPKKTPPKRDK